MMSANWSNIKTSINNTFQELRREVRYQIRKEIKRPFPVNPKVKNMLWGDQHSNSSTNLKTEDSIDQHIE